MTEWGINWGAARRPHEATGTFGCLRLSAAMSDHYLNLTVEVSIGEPSGNRGKPPGDHGVVQRGTGVTQYREGSSYMYTIHDEALQFIESDIY